MFLNKFLLLVIFVVVIEFSSHDGRWT